MKVLSGQTTVVSSGTAVPLGSQEVFGSVYVKALPQNTGIMYIGNNGTGSVNSANGMPLSAGDIVLLDFLHTLSEIAVNGTVGGEKVAWLLTNSEAVLALRSWNG